MHHELWRYYPQLLQVSDDLTEPWVLDLWDLAPTPAKAGRLRAAPIEKLLRQHRIRRTNADTVLRILQELPSKLARAWWRQPASTCVRCLPGCVSSTANCDGAGSQLDAMCAAIGETDADSGEGLQQRGVIILRSMPGIGRTISRHCCARARAP